MTRARVFGFAFLLLLGTARLSAIGPSYVMFYGGPLKEPFVAAIDVAGLHSAEILWNTMSRGWEGSAANRQRAPLPDLSSRDYINIAIFWGRWSERPRTPEGASQHGRLYLPTATAPAVVLSTQVWMEDAVDTGTGHPRARPIPTNLNPTRDALGEAGFVAGWSLSGDEIAALRRLGVPGL